MLMDYVSTSTCGNKITTTGWMSGIRHGSTNPIMDMVVINNMTYSVFIHGNGNTFLTIESNGKDLEKHRNAIDYEIVDMICYWCKNPYFADMNLDYFVKKTLNIPR